MPLGRRAAYALRAAAIATFLFWAAKDIFYGEWKTMAATVTGRHYRAPYTTTERYNCGTTEHPRRCTRTVRHPAEHIIYVRLEDGTADHFDNRAAFYRYGDGQKCSVTYRVGRSGFRWFGTIQ